MKVVYRPIGTVRSPFSEAAGMPIQPSRARGIRGTVELEQRARASGCRRLWLMSTLNAVPFYQALGFERLRDAMHELPEGARLPCVEMNRPLGEA